MLLQALKIWLEQLKATMATETSRSGHWPQVCELVANCEADESNGRLILRSELLRDQQQYGSQERVYLCELNRYLRTFGKPGSRLQISKPRRQDCFLVEPLKVEPKVVIEPDYRTLAQEIDKLPSVKSAVLVQHSGVSAKGILGQLLAKGAQIELYLQDPEKAVNKAQATKISAFKADFHSFYKEDRIKGRLRVYYVRAPMAVRIAKIEDIILAVGFYTYHPVSKQVAPCGITLQGHNRPMIIAEAGSEAYTVLADMVDHLLADYVQHRGRCVGMIAPRQSVAKPVT